MSRIMVKPMAKTPALTKPQKMFAAMIMNILVATPRMRSTKAPTTSEPPARSRLEAGLRAPMKP